jgi:hypothetical protein
MTTSEECCWMESPLIAAVRDWASLVNRHRKRGIGAVFLATAVFAAAAQAPSNAPPSGIARPSASRANESSIASHGGNAKSAEPPTDSPFKYGPLVLRPHYRHSYVYGDGIQAQPGQPLTTGLHRISPGFAFEVGKNWQVDYTPTWDIYSNSAFRDVLGHVVHFDGIVASPNWAWHVGHDYTSSEQPLVETGQQTAQETSDLTIDLLKPLTTNFAYQATFTHSFRFVTGYPDSFSWSLSQGGAYKASNDLDIALGLMTGYDASIKLPASFLLRPLARISWRAAHKLTLAVEGGVERRRALSGKKQKITNPTYRASLEYRPFEHTILSFEGSRQTAAALLGKETRELESWSGRIEQRFLGHLYFSLSGTRQNAEHVMFSAPTLDRTRQDRNDSYEVRLWMNFLRRAKIAVLYQENSNSSSQPGFGFNGSQVGAEFEYRY